MRLISHRGNLTGSYPLMENTPVYIREAVDAGYEVEIDVWGDTKGGLHLGHDAPEHAVSIDWLCDGPYIIHAKNDLAIEPLQYYRLHWFWHNTDDYTLTSQGLVWAYPDKSPAGTDCIAVLPEIHSTSLVGFAGICSDYIDDYARDFKR